MSDEDFVEAFGKFQAPRPLLALRYHGYQFGEYNAFLGDGRGFLYGQVRDTKGDLYDHGYQRVRYHALFKRGRWQADAERGRVREVLAAESLHRAGVRTSRCLSLIETGRFPLARR